MNGVEVKKAPKKRPRDKAPPMAVLEPQSHPSAQSDYTQISEADLLTTQQTLTTLGRIPEQFQTDPRFKSLRAVLYPLVTSAVGGNYVARVSDALSDSRWADAIGSLAMMRRHGEVPKLGAVQRWVRDVDAAGLDDTALRVLDAILRTAAPEQIGMEPTQPDLLHEGRALVRYPGWEGRAAIGNGYETPKALPPGKEKDALAGLFKVIGYEAGPGRNPPNLHDLSIYHATIPLARDPNHSVTRHDVPFVHGSFFLENVLTLEECNKIIRATEAIGYEPDVPLTNRIKSVLAHNVVWLADDAFLRPLYDRVKKFLPPTLGGGTVSGINGRFRCYRYQPGSVYRPHVDGAWPCSGRDPITGQYVYDATDGHLWSRLTFLMYLNEGFEGGCTTYFTPAMEEGKLRAMPVVPRVGCALVFPHGDTFGCLVHEGSAVTGGTKYIIRTEVLYTTNSKRSNKIGT